MSELTLLSGATVGLFEGPAPSFDDVIFGLERERRWRGQTSNEWSVAHHLLLCLFLARRLGGTTEECCGAGLHDVEESVLGDVPTPLKRHLRVALPSGEVVGYEEGLGRPMRARILASLGARVGVEACESAFVQEVDAVALRIEALTLCHAAMRDALGPAPARLDYDLLELGMTNMLFIRSASSPGRLLLGEVLW